MRLITIRGNKLRVDGGKEIYFDEDVYQIIDVEVAIAVLTMPQRGRVTKDRIYGLIDDKIAWQVQDLVEYNLDYLPFAPDPYSGIDVYEEDPRLVVGTTWQGFRMLIDPQTGKIVGTDGWTK